MGWTFESRKVQSDSGSTLTFDTENVYAIPVGYGFFVDGKLEALDSAAERFHDAASGKLYFGASGGANPEEASAHDSAFTSSGNRDDVTIQDLRIENDAGDAISLKGGGPDSGKGLRVVNNTVVDVGRNGIDVTVLRDGAVENNTVHGALGTGINLASDIIRSTVEKTSGFAFEAGSHCRLRFRTAAEGFGELLLQDQKHGPSYGILRVLHRVPLRPRVEEHDVVFRMEKGFPSAHIDFDSPVGRYWLDGVRLEKVDVDCSADPRETHLLLANPRSGKVNIRLPEGSWRDLRGNPVQSPVSLAPFSSRVVVRD